MATKPAACRMAGVKPGESWLGPMSGTAAKMRWDRVWTTAVSFGQARCRWPFPFARRIPKCALTCRVSSPVASTATTGARSISLACEHVGSLRPEGGRKPPGLRIGHEAARGVRQRRVVRHFREPKGAPKLGPLGDKRDDAAVVRPQELPQHEEGKEPRLRV